MCKWSSVRYWPLSWLHSWASKQIYVTTFRQQHVWTRYRHYSTFWKVWLQTPSRPPRLHTYALQRPLVKTTTSTTIVPSRLLNPAPQLPLINNNVPRCSFTSRPPLTHGGQPSRPYFTVNVVIGFKEISVDLKKCVKDMVKQNYKFFSKLWQVVMFCVSRSCR